MKKQILKGKTHIWRFSDGKMCRYLISNGNQWIQFCTFLNVLMFFLTHTHLHLEIGNEKRISENIFITLGGVLTDMFSI